jgi:hypothetical protein
LDELIHSTALALYRKQHTAMAEAAGLVLGAIGLAGLFTLSVDCVHYVHDGFSRDQELEWARGQLYAYRIRLYAWGKACGFFRDEGYDKRLDNPHWKEHIRVQLTVIVRLFLDAEKISHSPGPSAGDTGGTELMLRPSHVAVIQPRLWSFLRRMRGKTLSEGRFLAALRYGFFEKRKLMELLQQLDKAVEALELVTRDLNLFEQQRHFVEIEVESISDPSIRSYLASLDDSGEMMDLISETASRQDIRLVAAGPGEPSRRGESLFERGSNDAPTIFFSAASKQVTKEDAADRNEMDFGQDQHSGTSFDAELRKQKQAWDQLEADTRQRICGLVHNIVLNHLRVNCRGRDSDILKQLFDTSDYFRVASTLLTIGETKLPMVFTWSRLAEIPMISRGTMHQDSGEFSFVVVGLDGVDPTVVQTPSDGTLVACHLMPVIFEMLTTYTPFSEYSAMIDDELRTFLHSTARENGLRIMLDHHFHDGNIILTRHRMRVQREIAELEPRIPGGAFGCRISPILFAGGLATVLGRDFSRGEWAS